MSAIDVGKRQRQTSAGESPVGKPERPLAEGPLVVIEPSKSWVALNLRDIWTYRELLYFLVWRDVKVRYKQTLLGASWAIIQPLFAMLIFTLFFGRLAGIKSDGVPYPLFAYAGLLPWTFFSNAITNSGNSLVGNANLITKVYFPRILIPAAAVMAGLVEPFFLLPSSTKYQPAGPPSACVNDRGTRIGGGNVDVGIERQLSRRALCIAFSNSALDVYYSCHLSVQYDSGQVALADVT